VAYVSTSDGTRLFYKDLGDGPPVLLLHSWAMHSGMWEYLLHPLLEAGHRVVALDRRGHGRSDYASHGFDLDTLTEDITTVLDHAGVDELAVLAHSTGGMEAVHLAARRPDVRALVLLAPLGPNMDGELGRAPLEATLAELRTDRPRWFRSQDDAYFARPHVPASDALVEEALAVLHQTPLEVATALATTAWTTDAAALAAALATPTLVLHGDADASAPLPLTGQRYADLIPGAELTVYPGAGHGFYATHAPRIARDTLAFLTRHHPATPDGPRNAPATVSAPLPA
jgi:non-heme chloroperoxidase